MTDRIDSFQGQYRFLSNFSPTTTIVDRYGITYRTAEHAYQAGKTEDSWERKQIAAVRTAGEAKRLGRHLTLPLDWDERRHTVMRMVLVAKFSDPDLARLLIETGDAELVEGNNWHDQFWGDCVCGRMSCDTPGENWLGQHLMHLRDELRNQITKEN